VAVLLALTSADILSVVPSDFLEAIADAENWDLNLSKLDITTYTQIEYRRINMGRLCVVD
jgi:hypothetical protein